MASGNVHRHRILLASGLLLVSLNLRPAIASISPVLGAVRRSTGLSPVEAGLLTTLPLICFGVLAPVAPRLVRRRGTGAVLLSCLVVLAVGIVVRSTASIGLFLGTFLIGVSVAVANVLMPGIVKHDFPGHVGLMTGLYAMMLSAGAALAAGVTAPISHLFDGNWRLATGLWALPVAATIFVVVPMRSHGRPTPESRALVRQPSKLWRSSVAWWVTLFMGLQSLEFYAALAWLPTVFHDRGVSVVSAGLLLALTNLVAIGAALVTPAIAERVPDARVVVLASVAFFALGTGGLLFDPRHLDALWAVLLGCGQGSAISLALMMMVLRSRNASEATALSGMAQGIGYLIAAIGPTLVGALYDVDHSWTLPLAVLLGLLVPLGVAGYMAARNRHVEVAS